MLPSLGSPRGVRPFLDVTRALHRLLDEVDAPCPVVDVWEVLLQPVEFGTFLLGTDRRRYARVHVGERLDKRLGVTRGQPRSPLGVLAEIFVAPRQYLRRRLGGFEDEVVWLLLAPLEPTLGPVDADAEVVLLSGGDLRDDHDALRTTPVSDEQVAVIIEPSPRDEGG